MQFTGSFRLCQQVHIILDAHKHNSPLNGIHGDRKENSVPATNDSFPMRKRAGPNFSRLSPSLSQVRPVFRSVAYGCMARRFFPKRNRRSSAIINRLTRMPSRTGIQFLPIASVMVPVATATVPIIIALRTSQMDDGHIGSHIW